MSMSLDGFVAGPGDEIDWVFNGDQAAIAWKVEHAWNASLHIMGSRVFEGMASFWPTAESAFAPAMNQIPKLVFSARGAAVLETAAHALAAAHARCADAGMALPIGGESWAQARVGGGPLRETIAELKAGEGKPILAHGGAAFARSLIAHGLIDEYVLGVYPILLGQGLPIFDALPVPRPLALVDSQRFPSGVMAQTYRST
nr:dihydrofolate reductase family protein [Xanthomonas maliensis]